MRGPGVFGEVQVFWNITPARASEFETISGMVTMRDGQSVANITLKVCNDTLQNKGLYSGSLVSPSFRLISL